MFSILRKRINQKKISDFLHQNKLLIMQSTDKFLSSQFENGEFNRYDTIVRYLAIEDFFNKNSYGFKLYSKMQNKRGPFPGSEERFRNLIESVRKNGLNYNSPLAVGNNLELIDGSHRLSLALFFRVKLLPLKLSKWPNKIYYGINWFKDNGFTPEELKILQETKIRIFRQQGITL